MAKSTRSRIDYMPGDAALKALELAAAMYPDASLQALLDRLVITGLVALHWKPPTLFGADRDGWRLPKELGQ